MGKQYAIDLDPRLCVACGACAVACMDQNDVEPDGPMDMFRKIAVSEKGNGLTTRFVYLSLACMHCANAPCIPACPCGCISKDPDTGFTIYDNTSCIGCRSCSMACPFSAPIYAADGRMHKCDGCNTRVKMGLEPACVRVCPFDALSLTERKDIPPKHMKTTVAAIAEEIAAAR